MSARTAENELEFLKTAPIDKWWFKVKEPSESFTKLFNSLIDKRLFHIKLIRFTPGSGYLFVGEVTEIDEEGMWFLSHLFSNWQEMYEQAVPPWDQKQQSRGKTEQEKVCCECGVDKFSDLFYCGTCNKLVCSGCDDIHQDTHKVNCAHCAKSVYRDITDECPDCHKLICVPCMPEHKKMHQYQQEYGFSGFRWDATINDKAFDEILKNMRETFHWASSDEAERLAKEETERKQREETERKVREQAQRMYEKQQRDQEEFYKNLFGNMGHFSFKNNRNRTYTHTWDFGHWESDDDHQNTRCDPGSASSTLETAFSHLGLSPRATVQEVKRAFRRKAKEAHPDTGGSDAAFKALNEAYQKALTEAQRNER